LKVALAAITGSYEGTIVLSEKSPTASYRLTADGQGRPGSVKGSAAVSLRPQGNDTVVDVQGTVQAAGPVARVGQRLISSVSKMMMDRFFTCLQGKLTS
jgi:carbon monoxide dehydrogenase subunit G